MSGKVVWGSFAALFVTAMAGKQYLWSVVSTEVSSRRDEEHERAASIYKATIQSSKKYSIPSLTEDEKRLLLKDPEYRAKLLRLQEAEKDT